MRFLSYRNAAVILSETRSAEVAELWDALRAFTVTTEMIRKAGGNENRNAEVVHGQPAPKGLARNGTSADLVIKLTWREQVGVIQRGKKKVRPYLLKRGAGISARPLP